MRFWSIEPRFLLESLHGIHPSYSFRQSRLSVKDQRAFMEKDKVVCNFFGSTIFSSQFIVWRVSISASNIALECCRTAVSLGRLEV